MKKVILAIAVIGLFAQNANAFCTGFGNMRTCTDDAGNNYNVTRFGNMTTVDGSNFRTGSRWNSTTTDFGNMSMTNGRAANGNTWNSTTTNFGNMSTTNGMDSNGNSFTYTCTQFGCH